MIRFLIAPWLNLLCPSFFGIGMGPSGEESMQYGRTAALGDFATSQGEKNVSGASDFWNAILSGDQTKMSRFLGPAYTNINQRGQQELSTLAQFAPRSGGTSAATQHIGDTMRSEASNVEGGLLGTAASTVGSMGEGLLSTGLSAHDAAFSQAKTIQEQRAAKMNDIFKSIEDVAASVIPGGSVFKGIKSVWQGIKGSDGGAVAPTLAPGTPTWSQSGDYS